MQTCMLRKAKNGRPGVDLGVQKVWGSAGPGTYLVMLLLDLPDQMSWKRPPNPFFFSVTATLTNSFDLCWPCPTRRTAQSVTPTWDGVILDARRPQAVPDSERAAREIFIPSMLGFRRHSLVVIMTARFKRKFVLQDKRDVPFPQLFPFPVRAGGEGMHAAWN